MGLVHAHFVLQVARRIYAPTKKSPLKSFLAAEHLHTKTQSNLVRWIYERGASPGKV